MTVLNSGNKATFVGNGSVTAFPFSFPGVAPAYIDLFITDNLGNVTQIPANQYQVVLTPPVAPNPTGIGGTVNYPLGTAPPVAAGWGITILRALPLIQTTSLANQSTMYPTVIEQALDYDIMADQQSAELESRAIVVAVSDPTPLPLPPAHVRANQGLVFDSNGNPSVGSIPTSGIISPAMQPVTAASTLAVARQTLGVAGVLSAKSFGATPGSDSTVALQAWIRACQTQNLPGYIEAGTYFISAAIAADQGGPLIIFGPGCSVSGIGSISAANIQLTNPTQDGILLNNTDGTVIIKDLTISASSATSQTAGAGIHATGTSPGIHGLILERVKLINMAVGVNGAAGAVIGCTLRDCVVYASQYGIVLVSAGDSTIEDCYIVPQGGSAYGIYLGVDPGGMRIINNKIISGNCAAAIGCSIDNTDGDILIQSNSIELSAGTNTCILISGQTTGFTFGNIIIHGNQMVNSGAAFCVDIGPGPAVAFQGVAISGNVFSNGGVRLIGVGRFSVSGNAFYLTNTLGDIAVDATSSKGIIIGNSISVSISNSSATSTVVNNVGP